MSTEAIDPVMEAAQKSSWRLDTANGSMAPRSALDVLVDLNEKVSTGRVGEYQPVPLGFTPPDGNFHAPNEWMDLANYEGGVRAMVFMFEELAGLST